MLYHFVALGFGLLMLGAVLCTGIILFGKDSSELGAVELSVVIASFGSIALTGLAHGELLSLLLAFPWYFFMLPTFVNIFSVYSFANLHDIS